MNSPFIHLNAARVRAERRARHMARLADAATIVALVILAVVVADMALTTAAALPDTLARSAALAAW